jgi:hypothetical protein
MPAFQKSYSLDVGTPWFLLIVAVGMLMVVGVMAPIVLLVAIPVVMPCVFLPSWIFGGRLLVNAEPGFVRLTRQRFGWTHVRQLSFPRGERPALQVHRPHGHRPFGVMRVTTSAGYIEVQKAMKDALLPVAADLEQYFRS